MSVVHQRGYLATGTDEQGRPWKAEIILRLWPNGEVELETYMDGLQHDYQVLHPAGQDGSQQAFEEAHAGILARGYRADPPEEL